MLRNMITEELDDYYTHIWMWRRWWLRGNRQYTITLKLVFKDRTVYGFQGRA